MVFCTMVIKARNLLIRLCIDKSTSNNGIAIVLYTINIKQI